VAGIMLLCCVVNIGDAAKLSKIARKYGVTDGTISIGRGTVHNRILEFLKINEIRREIVTMIVKTELATEAIQGISDEMAFEKPHHGIAFTYAVSELIDGAGRTAANPNISEVKDSVYKSIYVVVDKGRAEDVIEAANQAGARGGTVVNARGSGIHEAQKFFSIEIEPEKEQVFIITKTELKDGIIAAIRERLGMDEPGNGIIFVLDVHEAYGLH